LTLPDSRQNLATGFFGQVKIEQEQMGTDLRGIVVHRLHELQALLTIVKNPKIEFQTGLLQRLANQQYVGLSILDQDNVIAWLAHEYPTCR